MGAVQWLRFLVAGGLAAAANLGSRFLYSLVLDYGWAVFAAHLTGMLIAFLLMRGPVFAAAHLPLPAQLTGFVVVNVLTVLQTLAISLLLAHRVLPALGWGDHDEAVAHFIGVMVPAITSYFGHKRLSFRSR